MEELLTGAVVPAPDWQGAQSVESSALPSCMHVRTAACRAGRARRRIAEGASTRPSPARLPTARRAPRCAPGRSCARATWRT